MKKLVILTSVLALGAISAMAQGTLNANNSGLATNYISASADGSNPVIIGKPATAAGFAGAGPSGVTFSLYGAANGTALATLESSQSLLTTTLGPTGTLIPGTVAFGNPYTLPTSSVFNGSQQDEFIVYASTVSGGVQYGAWSTEATGITPVTFGTPPNIFGAGAGLINSIILVPTPEPSTIALGALGAAALLFRRRK